MKKTVFLNFLTSLVFIASDVDAKCSIPDVFNPESKKILGETAQLYCLNECDGIVAAGEAILYYTKGVPDAATEVFAKNEAMAVATARISTFLNGADVSHIIESFRKREINPETGGTMSVADVQNTLTALDSKGVKGISQLDIIVDREKGLVKVYAATTTCSLSATTRFQLLNDGVTTSSGYESSTGAIRTNEGN